MISQNIHNLKKLTIKIEAYEKPETQCKPFWSINYTAYTDVDEIRTSYFVYEMPALLVLEHGLEREDTIYERGEILAVVDDN